MHQRGAWAAELEVVLPGLSQMCLRHKPVKLDDIAVDLQSSCHLAPLTLLFMDGALALF